MSEECERTAGSFGSTKTSWEANSLKKRNYYNIIYKGGEMLEELAVLSKKDLSRISRADDDRPLCKRSYSTPNDDTGWREEKEQATKISL